MNREYNEYLGAVRMHDFGDALDSLWAGISGSRPSDRAPTGLAASRVDPGRKEEEK